MCYYALQMPLAFVPQPSWLVPRMLSQASELLEISSPEGRFLQQIASGQVQEQRANVEVQQGPSAARHRSVAMTFTDAHACVQVLSNLLIPGCFLYKTEYRMESQRVQHLVK